MLVELVCAKLWHGGRGSVRGPSCVVNVVAVVSVYGEPGWVYDVAGVH